MPFAGPALAVAVAERDIPVRCDVEELPPGGEDSVLKRAISGGGLLDGQPRHYAVRALACAALFGLVCACALVAGDARLRILCAVPAAFLFGQLGFLAHDASHGQVFRGSRGNYLLSV